jgi:hypothetical protein
MKWNWLDFYTVRKKPFLYNMKNLTLLFFLFLLLTMTSCELVGDIFGAGVYTGMFIVIVVIVLIVVIVARIFKR